MKKCTELAKWNGKSLVEVKTMETGEVIQYVVCSRFNNAKRFGAKWDQGDYFNVWYNDAEKQLRAATLYLYGIKEPEVPYERVLEFARKWFECNMDIIETDPEDFREEYNITETEAELFEVKEELFPSQTLYKIVECEMVQTRRVKVKVVMPDDEPDNNAEDYIENRSYLDDYDTDDDDWECEDYNVVRSEITKEEYEDMGYNEDEIWNDVDFRDNAI